MQSKKLTLHRLMKEQASIERQPIPNAIVTRKDVLNFHFCLHDLEGPYEGGFYHGVFQLHENYPFAAPKLIFYTPSGRFDTNLPVCTSFTNYHQQSWTSAWNVRTLILATISFMYSEQPSYGCRQDSNEVRIKYAKNSMQFNRKSKEFMELFGQKLSALNGITSIHIQQDKQVKGNYVNYARDYKGKQQEVMEQFIEEKKRNRWRPWVKKILIVAVVVGIIVLVAIKLQ